MNKQGVLVGCVDGFMNVVAVQDAVHKVQCVYVGARSGKEFEKDRSQRSQQHRNKKRKERIPHQPLSRRSPAATLVYWGQRRSCPT